MVVHRDRQRLLGVLLADDVLVQEFLDLPRAGDRAEQRLAAGELALFLADDVVAQVDAVGADVESLGPSTIGPTSREDLPQKLHVVTRRPRNPTRPRQGRLTAPVGGVFPPPLPGRLLFAIGRPFFSKTSGAFKPSGTYTFYDLPLCHCVRQKTAHATNTESPSSQQSSLRGLSNGRGRQLDHVPDHRPEHQRLGVIRALLPRLIGCQPLGFIVSPSLSRRRKILHGYRISYTIHHTLSPLPRSSLRKIAPPASAAVPS